MSEPLPSYDELDELVDTDPIRLRDAAFRLLAEVDRLKAELATQATAMGDLLDALDAREAVNP